MNSEMTFSYFSQTRGIVRVRIYHHEGYSRPEQLASVGDPPHCRASPPPGIFLMVDVGLGEICGFRPGEPKLCSVG